jgi:FMN reductase [NAD(P)H]
MKNEQMPSHHGKEDQLEGEYPNQTLKLLIQRASCRSFSDKKIPPDVMEHILEAGIRAPSGGNLQPFSIIKIEENQTKRKLAELCERQYFIAQAPANLLFCIDWHRIWRWAELETAPFTATSSFRHFWISFQDTIIAAQNICAAADSLGLGSVYIGSVLECLKELKEIFQLPDGVFPVVFLSLGYPRTKPSLRKKLTVDVIVHDECYHEMSDRELLDAFNKKYPDIKIEITEERLTRISKVCREVHGEEFARKCIEKIKENGYINPVQRYFGLHYCANSIPEGNDIYLRLMEEFGFNWFKKYQPFENKTR